MEIICIISDNKDIGNVIETSLVNMGFKRLQTYMDRFTDKFFSYPSNVMSVTNIMLDELESKGKLIDRFRDNNTGIEYAISKPYGSTKYVINAYESTALKLIETYNKQVKCILVNKCLSSLDNELHNKLKNTECIEVDSKESITDTLMKILK